MAIKDIAGRLSEAARAADAIMEGYHRHPGVNAEELAQLIRRYITVKLQLPEEAVSDNITFMVRHNISASTGISIEELKEMDRPGALWECTCCAGQKDPVIPGCAEEAGR